MRTTERRRSGRTGSRFAAAGLAAVLLIQAGVAWAGSLNYPDFSSLSGLQRNGSAEKAGTRLRLADAGSEAGSVFTKTKVVNPNKAIHTRFRIHMHDGSDSPADGMAFVLHRDPRGPSALGDAGSELGYAGTAAIMPSVAVEFDLYPGGPDAGVIRIVRDADQGSPLREKDHDLYGEDRKLWVWVDYSPRTDKFKVYVSGTKSKPANPKLKKTIDLSQALHDGNGSKSYAGFTGATGGEFAVIDVLKWRLRNP